MSYYNDYDNYMRSVLGYPSYEDTYLNDNANYFPYSYENPEVRNKTNAKELYPDLYYTLKPMVVDSCQGKSRNDLNKDFLDEESNKIYKSVENKFDVVSVNTRSDANNLKQANNGKTSLDNASEQRGCCNNNPLKALITIMLIDQMLKKPPVKPHHPHPMPKPPFMPPRPPYMY